MVASVKMLSRSPSPLNEQLAEAGPSRPRPPSPQAPPTGSPLSESYLKDFDLYSPLSRSEIPREHIKGTNLLVTDVFAARTLAEIHDPKLMKDLPSLFPPPQPPRQNEADAHIRPLWDLSTEAHRFFPPSQEEHPIPFDPRIQELVKKFHDSKHDDIHFNQVLTSNRSYKNPHFYTRIVEVLGVDESRSHLPQLDTGKKDGSWRSIFPFTQDELIEADPIAMTKLQEEEAKKRHEAKMNSKGKRSIDFVFKFSSTAEPARKTAWTKDKADHR